MPYKVFKDGEKWCVHKLNSDNSDAGAIKGGCHNTQPEAAAQARAIYASEKKEITEETLLLLKEIAEDEEEDKSERASAVLAEWKERIEEKDYGYDSEPTPYGVFSFAELEKQRNTQEKVQELSQIMCDFRTMISNIINTPEMMIEGGKLKAIDSLYNEFRVRVKEDLDAVDSEEKAAKREETAEDKVQEAIAEGKITNQEIIDAPIIDMTEEEKARADVSAADRKRAVAEYGKVSYADEENKKYPIDTEAHIRAAWSYINMPKNAAKYPDKGAAIKRKIIAAWKKKISPDGPPKASQKDLLSKLKEIGEAVKSWFVDEESGEFNIWKEGEVYWWLARYSNNFRDDDNPKEIISSASHKRFVELVKEGKAPLPELWAWHVKQWRVGKAKSVAYDETGFAVAIGTFDAGTEEVAEALKNSKESIKVSHGMPISTIKRDPVDPTIIIEHETREISFLPAWAAANKLTGFAVLNLESKEESMGIPEETKQEWIKKLNINPETLKNLEDANTADAEKAKDEGLESKETEVAQPAPQTPAEPPAETLTLESLKSAVTEAVTTIVNPMVERITALENGMKELKEASDKRDEKLKGTPAASLSAILGDFAKSAIGSPETQVDGRTSLAKEKPQETAANADARTGIPFIDKMLAGNNQ